jgi:phosphoribosyl-AMP cyclohydrolase
MTGSRPATIAVESASPPPPSASDPAESAFDPRTLKFNEAGLICAVAQQHDTREVLMVAWMDAEALRRTLETRAATYFSRSRQSYWVKGETSGHTQRVVEIHHDCDGDALLLLVDQLGPACHTGSRSCFDDRVIPLALEPGV